MDIYGRSIFFDVFCASSCHFRRILFSTSSRQRWEMRLALGLAMDGDNSFHTLEAPWSGCGSLGLAYTLKLVLPKTNWDNQIKQYQTIRYRVIYGMTWFQNQCSQEMSKVWCFSEPMASPMASEIWSPSHDLGFSELMVFPQAIKYIIIYHGQRNPLVFLKLLLILINISISCISH